MPVRWPFQIEQPENLTLTEPYRTNFGQVGKKLIENLPLLLQDGGYLLFDRTISQHPRDGNASRSTNTMSTINRLIFYGRIPPAIKKKYVATKL
jgi:hypothetical protein